MTKLIFKLLLNWLKIHFFKYPQHWFNSIDRCRTMKKEFLGTIRTIIKAHPPPAAANSNEMVGGTAYCYQHNRNCSCHPGGKSKKIRISCPGLSHIGLAVLHWPLKLPELINLTFNLVRLLNRCYSNTVIVTACRCSVNFDVRKSSSRTVGPVGPVLTLSSQLFSLSLTMLTLN